MQQPGLESQNQASSKVREKQIIWVGTILLLLACSIWLGFVGLRVVRQIDSSKWTVVEGRVLDMNYQEFSSGKSSRRGVAELTVRYEYKVNGQTYQSDEFMAGVKKYKMDADHVSALTNDYRIGARVSVLYNPKYPERAALRSMPNLMDKLTIAFLVVMIGFIVFNFKPKVR